MTSTNFCAKCGRIIRRGFCICVIGTFGMWAVGGPIWGVKPPPSRAVAPITTTFVGAPNGATGPSSQVSNLPDQISGRNYTSVWPPERNGRSSLVQQAQHQGREAAALAQQ